MFGGQIGNIDLVKQLNGATVYRLIDQQSPISRVQIADVSGLAPASVTKITRQLLEHGLVKEVAQQTSTGGRRAISLTTEHKPFHSLAVRLGRERIELTLFDLAGSALANHSEHFQYDDQKALLKGLIQHLHFFIKKNQKKINKLIAIAITLPGLINASAGIVDYMPNIAINKLYLSELIQSEFDLPCFIGNDIRSLALAECYFGVSKDYHDTLLVSIHNGVGAGIIVNGEVFLGYNRNAGEIGHIQIDPLGKKCQCGNFGCLETLASNPAIIEQTRQLLVQGHKSCLQKKNNLSVSDICKAALAEDELAKQVLLKVGNYLGKAIAMTVNLFNPQLIVISGEITQASNIVFQAIQQCLKKQSLTTFHSNLPILTSVLNNKPTLSAFSLIKHAMLNGVLLQRIIEKDK